MPNRIIRESSRSSPSLARLSHGAERLFWRLVTLADDFGRFQAEPILVRSACFPRMLDTVTAADVEGWLEELYTCGHLRAYVVTREQTGPDSPPYAYFVSWSKHQSRRAKHSKYPDPRAPESRLLHASADTCEQMPSAGICEHLPAYALEDSRNRGLEDSRTRGRDLHADASNSGQPEPSPAEVRALIAETTRKLGTFRPNP